jgi:predicted phosphodiesterase
MTAPTALLYDIHGNLEALRAVLDDARAAGADNLVLGGDYAAFGAWPAETVAELERLDPATTVWIRGNWDRWLADELAGARSADQPDTGLVRGAARFALGALDEATVRRLGALDADTTRTVPDGRSALICHGSPGSDMTSFLPRAADTDDDLAGTTAEPLLVFGHTHLQFRRPGPRGIELLNPGSVGLPLDGDTRAAYALLYEDGIELRRVAYAHDASVGALRALGEPWSDEIADRLQRGHA